jgi:hypothetical protein
VGVEGQMAYEACIASCTAAGAVDVVGAWLLTHDGTKYGKSTVAKLVDA